MNILFDFITTQTSYGGGGCEYVRRVFYALQQYLRQHHRDVNIIGIVDSSIGQYPYSDLSPESLVSVCSKVVDIKGHSLCNVVKENKIDKLFVGLSQVWAKRYSFQKVDCEVITVTHDIHDEELESIRFYSYQALFGNTTRKLRQMIARCVIAGKKELGRMPQPMANMVKTLSKNQNWHCITVSEYSKYSFIYHLGVPEDKIEVLYSPERIMQSNDSHIDNADLRNLIAQDKRYYLIVSAGRPEKNAERTLKAFKQYLDSSNDSRPIIVTVGMHASSKYEGHINLKPLSESDLVMAYKHCYALVYPSVFEGFGYPPVEAMKYGKPILASNVTSIPEVLADAPIYFSPFYEADIFKAFCSLTDHNYALYQAKAIQRYKEINNRQEKDLQRLISIIVD